ncbi:adenylate and guanylate cyclase catalytic domain-containing protein [Blastocladiella britannica]|nr:adenylate and guanylate cyclase catalytic domain-containing protein [Blastocladiella britannica]
MSPSEIATGSASSDDDERAVSAATGSAAAAAIAASPLQIAIGRIATSEESHVTEPQLPPPSLVSPLCAALPLQAGSKIGEELLHQQPTGTLPHMAHLTPKAASGSEPGGGVSGSYYSIILAPEPTDKIPTPTLKRPTLANPTQLAAPSGNAISPMPFGAGNPNRRQSIAMSKLMGVDTAVGALGLEPQSPFLTVRRTTVHQTRQSRSGMLTSPSVSSESSVGEGVKLSLGSQSLRNQLRQRFGAADLDKRFAKPAIQRAFYDYYYHSYVMQWRVMAGLALLVAVMFLLQARLFSQGTKDPERQSQLLGVLVAMACLPVLELSLSVYPRIFRPYGRVIHFVMLLVYGVFLASLEFYLESVSVPAYMFIFVIFVYAGSCQDALPLLIIGGSATTLDCIFLAIAVTHDSDLAAACRVTYAQDSTEGVSNLRLCAARIGGNALLFVAVNVGGMLYAINSWNYTRKTFLNNRELYLRKRKYEDELLQAEKIALSILPRTVWDELKGGQHQKFEFDSIFHKSLMYSYSNVSILFGDIAGFTALSGTVSAPDLVKLLNRIFNEFDQIVIDLGIEKIKTIGDCYMIAAGAPEPVPDHAYRAVLAGLRMIEVIMSVRDLYPMLALRVGIHSGDVHAGLIGHEKLIFDVFSNDVLIAGNVEQTGTPNKVHISQSTYAHIKTCCHVVPGLPIRAYGVEMDSWFVASLQDSPSASGKLAMDNRNGDSLLNPNGSVGGKSNNSSKGAAGILSTALLPRLNVMRESVTRASGLSIHSAIRGTANPGTAKVSSASIPSSVATTKDGNDKAPTTRLINDPFTLSPPPKDATATTGQQQQQRGRPSVGMSSKMHQDLVSALGIDYAINYITCRFRDSVLEQDFQENYVLRAPGKTALAVVSMTLVLLVLVAFDWTTFRTSGGGWVVKSYILVPSHAFLLSLFGLVSYVTLAKYLTPSAEEMGGMTIEPTGVLGLAVRAARNINPHILCPTLITILFLSRTPFYFMSPVAIDYLYVQALPIFMVSTLWTRIPALTVAITLMVLIFATLVAVTLAVPSLQSTDLFWMSLYLLAMLLITYFVMRKMEIYIRQNYILKKGLAQKQYEIDDLRIKSERLLFKLLPRPAVLVLKERLSRADIGEIAESVESAGIMFCSICSFKHMDQASMRILNDIICKFDALLAKYGIEKIKTIGPIYMAASGLSHVFDEKNKHQQSQQAEVHVENLANFALALRSKMQALNKDYPKAYSLRIGLAHGPISAGIIGKTKFSFDVWGDTCNTASRMDSTGVEDHIQVTEAMYHALRSKYVLRERGVITVKGKGEMKTYFLLGKKGRLRSNTSYSMRPSSSGPSLDVSVGGTLIHNADPTLPRRPGAGTLQSQLHHEVEP